MSGPHKRMALESEDGAGSDAQAPTAQAHDEASTSQEQVLAHATPFPCHISFHSPVLHHHCFLCLYHLRLLICITTAKRICIPEWKRNDCVLQLKSHSCAAYTLVTLRLPSAIVQIRFRYTTISSPPCGRAQSLALHNQQMVLAQRNPLPTSNHPVLVMVFQELHPFHTWKSLPYDVFLCTFLKLPEQDLKRVRQVSRTWKEIANSAISGLNLAPQATGWCSAFATLPQVTQLRIDFTHKSRVRAATVQHILEQLALPASAFLPRLTTLRLHSIIYKRRFWPALRYRTHPLDPWSNNAGFWLPCVANRISLQHLDLGNTDLANCNVSGLSNLTNLRALHLGGTGVTDVCCEPFSVLTNLQQLALDRNPVTGRVLIPLSGLLHLTELNLHKCKLSDCELIHVAIFTNLQRLNLMNTSISDAGFKHLAGLKRLSDLRLIDTAVTIAGLTELTSAECVGVLLGTFGDGKWKAVCFHTGVCQALVSARGVRRRSRTDPDLYDRISIIGALAIM